MLTDLAIIKYKSRMEAIKHNARLNKTSYQEVHIYIQGNQKL